MYYSVYSGGLWSSYYVYNLDLEFVQFFFGPTGKFDIIL